MNSAAQIKNTNSRNTTIDAIKAIAAINVVFLHYNHVGGDLGEAYSRIIFNFTTFAVPFFFMVTGYYMIPLIQKESGKSYLLKILGMALCSTAFYFVFNLLMATDSHEWFISHYTPGTMFTWLTGQDDPAGFHLWYFYCLLWSFVIAYTVVKYSGAKLLYLIAGLLVIYHFTGINWFRCYTASLPAMAAGVFLFKNKDRIKSLSGNAVMLCMAFIIMFMGIDAYYQLFTSEIFYEGHILALCLFVFAISNPSVNGLEGLAHIGLKYSAYIYIFHVAVNNVLASFIEFDTVMLQVVRPFMVLGLALMLSMSYVYMKDNWRIRKRLWNI